MRFLDLYHRMCPNDHVLPDDIRRESIIAEMRVVVSAPTAKDARKAVEWWGWNSQQEMDAWIRKARKLWKERKGGDARGKSEAHG